MRLQAKSSKQITRVSLNASNIIEIELVFVLFERLFIQLGLSESIIYILDAINVILFIMTLHRTVWKKYTKLLLLYLTLVILSLIIALVNYSIWKGNLLFTIAEARNILRFFVFFIACVTFLTEESCKRIYRLLILFFFANIPVIIYQYITFHPAGVWTRGDYLNGLFGTTVGGNTFVNAILLVVVTYMLVQWSNGEISSKLFIPAVLLSLVVSGLMELKAFFIEFALLYGWYLVKKKKSRKERNINIIVILLIIIITYGVLQIMYQEYPWFRQVMTLSGLIDSLTGSRYGYSGSGDLNRFTGVFTIASEFFGNNVFNILFGIGLGNASAFSIGKNIPKFYSLYQSSHYNWFSATYTFVQSGAIGLVLYLYSFIYLFKKKKNEIFKINSQIMCLIALFLVFYGEALKTDAGYLIYFAIASGFINTTKNIK